jgi:hypothetical protein
MEGVWEGRGVIVKHEPLGGDMGRYIGGGSMREQRT